MYGWRNDARNGGRLPTAESLNRRKVDDLSAGSPQSAAQRNGRILSLIGDADREIRGWYARGVEGVDA
jgi:hypothetical protein